MGFSLHFKTGAGDEPFPEGMSLVKLGRLHENVGKIARDLVKDHPDAPRWTFYVRDDAGRTVLSGKLADYLTDSPST